MPTTTFGAPSVPHSTPLSTRALRAPVHNPYDKFTQPEFDAWIGDITSALKRALGQEEVKPTPSGPSAHLGDVSAFDEDVAEDSFAEIKARRAAKGKQRATQADADEGEGEDEHEVESSIIMHESEEEEDFDYEDASPSWNGEHHLWDRRINMRSEEDYEDEPEDVSFVGRTTEAIEILSDEDEDNTPSERMFNDEAKAGRYGHYERQDSETFEQDVEEDVVHERTDEDVDELEDEFVASDDGGASEDGPVEIRDPWSGPRTYAEDFYSGGKVPKGTSDPNLLAAEVDEAEERISEEAGDVEDGDFVENVENVDSHGSYLDGEDEFQAPIELPDKWSGPRTYAEDFYAGGDQPAEYLSTLTPSNLTPLTTTPREDEDISLVIAPGALSVAPDSQADFSYTALDDDDRRGTGLNGTEDKPQDGIPTFHMQDDNAAEMEEAIDAALDVRQGEYSADATRTNSPHTPDQNAASRSLLPHDRSLSPPRASPSGHVDWNWPPAFPAGRVLPEGSPLKALYTLGTAFHGDEVLEVSDDENEEQIELLPLGTSDLEIADDTPGDADASVAAVGVPPEIDQEYTNDSGLFSGQEPSFNNMPEDQQDSIYAELESIYMFSGNFQAEADLINEDVMLEEHLEPLVTPGVGFGEFPLDSMDGDSESLGILSDEVLVQSNSLISVSEDGPSGTNEPTVPLPQASLQHDSRSTKPVDNPLEESVDDLYTVSEPADDVHAALEGPDDPTIMVIFDGYEEQIEEVEFIVEEPITEGRRTEEPESWPVVREASVPGEEPTMTVLADYSESTAIFVAEAISELERVASAADGSEHANAETTQGVSSEASGPDDAIVDVLKTVAETFTNSAASPAEVYVDSQGADMQLEPEPEQAHFVAESEHHVKHDQSDVPITEPFDDTHMSPREDQYKGEHNDKTDDVQIVDDAPTTTDQAASQTGDITALDYPMLGPGIPMPISADPTIPDPASMHHTPVDSPSLSINEDEEADMEYQSGPSHSSVAIASAIPASLLKYASGHRTVSGLFTPMSDDASSPTSPVAPEGGSSPVEVPAVEDDASAAAVVIPDGDSNTVFAELPTAASEMSAAHVGEMCLPSLSPGNFTDVIHHETSLSEMAGLQQYSSSSEDDADADGDIDPDYEHAGDVQSPLAASTYEVPDGPADDSLASDLEAIPDVVVSTEDTAEAAVSQPTLSFVPEQTESPSADPEILSNPTHTEIEGHLGLNHPDLPPTRAAKRKRASPEPSIRLTRSRSTKTEVSGLAGAPTNLSQASELSDRSKDEQKAREDDTDIDNAAPITESPPVESCHNGAIPDHSSSRASSVASTVLSELSGATQPSPILRRLRVENTLPLLHAHGSMHRHNGLPALPLVPAAPFELDDNKPLAQAVEDLAEERPKAASSSSAIPSSTPVTRSNCRFHKISLPQEGEQNRAFFVVPGCSLNHELMEEEDIQDHGDATGDDHQYLTPDVESLGIDSYVLGLLRQLVGVDLLREQEVFYLPQRGERHRKPRKVLKPRISGVDAISGRISSAASTSRKRARSKPTAPSTAVSRASSVAYSDHMSRRSTVTSVSDNERSDAETKEDTKIKRSKDSKPNADLKRPIRRSRRLQSDALAYKPPEDSGEDSSDDEAGTRKGKGKKAAHRGVKRTRASEDGEAHVADEDVTTKRRKMSRQPSVTPEIEGISKTKPA